MLDDPPPRSGTVLNGVLSECDYHPMYARRHFVGRYRGYLEIKDSGISPDDHTLYRNNGQWSAGNPPINPAVCTCIYYVFCGCNVGVISSSHLLLMYCYVFLCIVDKYVRS